jgi:hypothetical protein
MILQLKLFQRALKSLDGLWVPALACFKMKEFVLASLDLPCLQKEEDVALEGEFRDAMPKDSVKSVP